MHRDFPRNIPLEQKYHYAPDMLSRVIAVKRPCFPKILGKIWAQIIVNMNFSAKGHNLFRLGGFLKYTIK